jgi:hypothetical protein
MGNDEQRTIPKPKVTEEHREKAKEMAKAYDDDRPTIGLPGSSNTVSGQAVSDWVDDDGNPKFGEVKHGEGVKREDVMGERHEGMADEE